MRKLILLLAVLVCGAGRTGESSSWSEVARASFSSENPTEAAIALATDKVLIPKGFTRSSTSDIYVSGRKLQIANYSMGAEATVFIGESVVNGCFTVSVYNHNKSKKGMASSIAMVIGAALGGARGVKANFFPFNTLCRDAF